MKHETIQKMELRHILHRGALNRIETANIRSIKANNVSECRKKLKLLLTNKPDIAIITECHLTNKHVELM